jgi:hypothetical protein
MEERVSVDRETGEVLDEGTEATISIGGGPEMPLHVMEDNVRRLGQMTLFEGHRVSLVQSQLKALKGSALPILPDVDLPQMRDRRYFVIEAQVVAVEHADDAAEIGEEVMTRIIKFAPVRSKTIDKGTAQRLLDTVGE